MSKFFRGGNSSSNKSESESSDDEQQQVQQPKTVRKLPAAHDFAMPSDSEDEEKRVVRAHKDKKFDELKDILKQIRNARNNKDFTRASSAFDDLVKVYEKSRTVFARQGISTPRFYVRNLVELEDYANTLFEDKDAKAALSKINAKAFPSLRQKIRKYTKELEGVAEYRVNPDPIGYESPEEEGEEDDESVEAIAPATKDKKRSTVSISDESDIDSDSDWQSDSSSSDTDTDLDTKKMEDLRKYFLKKEFRETKAGDKDKKKEERRIKQPRERKVKEGDMYDDDDGGAWTVVNEKMPVLFEPRQEVTHEVMIKKFNEIMATRGRLGTNRKQYVKTLEELLKISNEKKLGNGIAAKMMFNIIAALYELNTKINDYLDFDVFKKALRCVNELLDLLEANPNVHFSVKFTEEDENLKDESVPYRIQGSLLMSVQRLDTEFTKILQNADCHSNDYIEKLRGEKDICQLIERTEKYVESKEKLNLFDSDEICKVYMMRIEHLYYKYDVKTEGAPESDSATRMMERLCKLIYARDEEKRLRQRAMLCHVYFMALHDDWHKAKDLMLMSHLQAIVDHSDVDTQILYNRTICQLGLCAFRHGYIREAHQGLSEIQNTQRAKELLAQAIGMRQHDKTVEQEKVERQRQVPYHMHINVELMECVYLICSMLLEIPNMAICEFEMRRKLLSRSFHYQLKQNEKGSLVGPPENTREHVVAASRAMLAGDWKKCRDYIVNEKMNQKVWNLFRNSERVKEMVVKRIQEESLRTYLLMHSTVYTTVSLDNLAKLFDLDKKQAHSIISKMIIQEELSATLDEPTDCLMMHRVEPSRLQMLALNLTDKLQSLAENNEQIVEPRSGRTGYAGASSWFPGRERQGDKQKGDRNTNYQGDRRGGQQDNKRGQWGNQGNQQRRREPQKGRAY
ncbi:hypothetical protein WR25_00139 [Diploscapter pachys]|uniref:Eukaryotic translation initiation factor 3 subunit C n=1 Tax=Diploscapter pachys TaxID=2018661 RepID=A0A2A2JLV4_9BILA|nr:hypothetical protein WR25_00139 [Diploscapter pachys]